MKAFDVIIIGAGASGLMAAKQLSSSGKQVCILEAKDHIGGRIHTIADERFSYPVETGAEFIHGKLPYTFGLIEEAKMDSYQVKGNVYQVRNGKWNKENDFIERSDELEKALKELRHDMPLQQFLEEQFPGAGNKRFRESVTGYAEGYDAADASKFSTMSFKNELQNEDEDNYRITSGYTPLMQYLWMESEKHGAVLRLNTVVKEVHWKMKNIKLVTAGGAVYQAKQLITTVSLGVWQSRKGSKGHISFTPELTGKRKAAKQLGFGGVIKVILQFEEVFWKDKAARIGFIISDEAIPTWWTQQPDKHAMLNGWVAGPAAMKMKGLTEQEVLQKAIASLSKVFGMKAAEMKRRLKASHVFNWITDPFSRGAYSYQVVGSIPYRHTLSEPVAHKLFFAGEAIYKGNEMGTVEAALASGDQVAKQVLSGNVIVEKE